MNNVLIVLMLVHVLFTALLYVILTFVRAPKVWNIGVKKDGTNPWQFIEPRVSANLSNQFEWPIFFYAICILLVNNPELDKPIYSWLAGIFIVGRIVHSIIQILTKNIRLRGLVFSINFVAVFSIWIIFAIDILLLSD